MLVNDSETLPRYLAVQEPVKVPVYGSLPLLGLWFLSS